MKLKSLVLMTILLIPTIWSIAQAEPTPVAKSITWDHSGENLDGIFIYWAMESETIPRVYDDSRKIDIQDETARSILLLTVKPDSTDSMCFKLTAYNTAMKESGFAEEVCGYFGFEALANVSIE